MKKFAIDLFFRASAASENATKSTDELLNAIDRLDPHSTSANAEAVNKALDDLVAESKKGDQKKTEEV
jgi:hypothetical protein